MLSILQREMRITSRRPRTFRVRVITSVGAFVSGAVLILLGGRFNGESFFQSVIFFSFWFCLIQGVRRASSSIADEKRDGTLGLLFLTDLTALDIVAGKAFSIATPLVQPLLAFVPVLTISVVLGGTTGGEVFRATIVLASVLVYSIATGLIVSSFSRKAQDTGLGTLIFLIVGVFVPRWISYGPLSPLRYFSPWSAFTNIPDPGYRVNGDEFVYSVLFMNSASVLMLLAAAYFLPRRWETEGTPTVGRTKRQKISNQKRGKILDRNPGEWLAVRNSLGSVSSRLLAGVILLLAFGGGIMSRVSYLDGPGLALIFFGGLLLVIRIASEASFPLAEARRSGEIEMLLSTPMDPRCLITGQVAALRTQFVPLLGAILVAGVFGIVKSTADIDFAPLILCIWATLVCCSVAAMGMWMGLRERSPNAAFFKTILFTLVVPGFFWCVSPIFHIMYLVAADRNLRGRKLLWLITPDKERLMQQRPPGWPPRIPVPPKLQRLQ